MIIEIDYDEGDASTYRAVVAISEAGDDYRFESGDVVKDFRNAAVFANGKDEYYTAYSSSTDQFVLDGDDYIWQITVEYGSLIVRKEANHVR